MQHCLQLITPVLVPNHEHDAFLQPIKPSHLPKTALAASWIHLRAITYHHMERSETWVHHSTCILYFFHQHLMSWGGPASAITPVTAFGRLELEAGAGMVWEKNTVGLAGAGAGGWSGVRGKYYWAGAGVSPSLLRVLQLPGAPHMGQPKPLHQWPSMAMCSSSRDGAPSQGW